MQRSILAVSSDAEFIQQIRSHLEEGGRFRVSGAANGHDALTLSNNNFYDVAILDAEISDVPFVPFSRDLVAIQPDLKILVYPLQNNPHHPALAGLVAHGFLNKPFFGPEVGSALANLFQEIPPEPKVMIEQIDDQVSLWLQQPEIATKRIEQLLGATTASSGLLVMRNQIIAGSGSMEDSTISNVIGFLGRYWKDEDNSELVRFLRMEENASEYLVYATKLISNVVLVLIYPPVISIQQVRSEVNQVKNEFQLTSPDATEPGQDHQEKATLGDKPKQPDKHQTQNLSPNTGETIFSEIEMPDSLEEETDSEDISNVLSESELRNLDTLLANMPPPDPELIDEDIAIPALPISELEPPAWVDGLEEVLPAEEEVKQSQLEPEASPEFVLTDTASEMIDQAAVVEDFGESAKAEPFPLNAETPAVPDLPSFDYKLPWESESAPMSENPAISDLPLIITEAGEISSIPASESQIETQQEIQADVQDIPQWDDTKPTLSSFRFNYTCIMIPNNPKQYLARDLSERLGFILPQLHLAEGWRLTGISIRPLYLLWTVSVPLEICPIQIIRDIRTRTTSHIFSNFPEIAENIKNNDFWFSGFLVISGFEPPSVNLIYDFISQTRKNQELNIKSTI